MISYRNNVSRQLAIIIQFGFSMALLAACAPAEYHLQGGDLNSINNTNACLNCPNPPGGNPPGTSPTPPGGTPNPSPTPSPTPATGCAVKAFLRIDMISAKDKHGCTHGVCLKDGDIELCALSKDFFGHLKSQLSPNWSGLAYVKQVDLILDSDKSHNRVEAANGMKLCILRVAPSANNRVRFISSSGSAIPTGGTMKYIFDFKDSDVMNSVGGGNCELRVPGGQYQLRTAN